MMKVKKNCSISRLRKTIRLFVPANDVIYRRSAADIRGSLSAAEPFWLIPSSSPAKILICSSPFSIVCHGDVYPCWPPWQIKGPRCCNDIGCWSILFIVWRIARKKYSFAPLLIGLFVAFRRRKKEEERVDNKSVDPERSARFAVVAVALWIRLGTAVSGCEPRRRTRRCARRSALGTGKTNNGHPYSSPLPHSATRAHQSVAVTHHFRRRFVGSVARLRLDADH